MKRAIFLFCYLAITISFFSCKKDNNPGSGGDTGNTDPRNGSIWTVYYLSYHYSSTADIRDLPAGEPDFGTLIDTIGTYKWIAKDTLLDGKKWLAIYISEIYSGVELRPQLYFYLQKRSDGWWLKNPGYPNHDEEGLWLPFDNGAQTQFNCVNFFSLRSFYPGHWNTTLIYGNANADKKYLIAYREPDIIDDDETLTDTYYTKYNITGQLLDHMFMEERSSVAGDPLYYYDNLVVKVGSFTR